MQQPVATPVAKLWSHPDFDGEDRCSSNWRSARSPATRLKGVHKVGKKFEARTWVNF